MRRKTIENSVPGASVCLRRVAEDARRELANNGLAVHIRVNTRMTRDRVVIDAKENTVVVTSSTERGLVYGLNRLMERVRLGESLQGNVSFKPAFDLRLSNSDAPLLPHGELQGKHHHLSVLYNKPEAYIRDFPRLFTKPRFQEYCHDLIKSGYNGVVVPDHLYLVNFDGFGVPIYPGNSPQRGKNKLIQNYFSMLLDIATENLLDFYVYADEVTFPDQATPYIGERCPANPKLWDVIRHKYDEFFSLYPEAAGAMVRFGEIYIHEDNAFSGVSFSDHSCERCERMSYDDKIRRLVNEIYSVVVEKHGKRMIFRTWDFGTEGFHANPERYEAISRGLPTRDLLMGVKYTKTDFWLKQPLNPCPGTTPHQTIIEIQCKNEYEGMGHFPCLKAATHKKALREFRGKGAVGAWIWPMEGGKGITHLIFGFKGFTKWIEANHYIVSRLLWGLNLNVEKLAGEWAQITFGRKAADVIVQILMMSEKAAEKTFFIDECANETIWISQKHVNRLAFNANPEVFDTVPIRRNRGKILARIKRGVKDYQHMLDLLLSQRDIIDSDLFIPAEYSLANVLCAAKLCHRLIDALIAHNEHRDQEISTARFREIIRSLSDAKRAYDSGYGIYNTQNIVSFIER